MNNETILDVPHNFYHTWHKSLVWFLERPGKEGELCTQIADTLSDYEYKTEAIATTFNCAYRNCIAIYRMRLPEYNYDIMLHAPMRQREEEHTEAWEELISRLRFEAAHPDRELLALLADKEAKIGRLKEQVTDLQRQLEKLKALASVPVPPIDESSIYEHQLQQAQEFVSENSKADVSRLRDLLRKIMPAKFHQAIDDIKETGVTRSFQINGGQNQILPNAKVGVQKLTI